MSIEKYFDRWNKICRRAPSVASVVLLFIFLVIPATTHADTSTGLVGYWTFDGKDTNWNTNTTIDRSGNSNTGTLTSMSTSTSPVAGYIGQALKFNGTSSFVNIGANTSLADLPSVTFSTWIKPSSLGGGNFARIIEKGKSGSKGWSVYFDSSSAITFDVEFPTYLEVVSAAGGIIRNKWQHVVVVWDGSTTATNIKIYINGVLQSHSVDHDGSGVRASDSAETTAIGKSNVVSGRVFDGNIDDVRIYNRALSTTDVAQLYKQGAAKFATSPTTSLTSGLVGYWTFDGKDTNWNTNTTIDRSGNSNTGTLTNTSTSTTPVAGKVGQALRFFNAIDDRVSVSDASSLDLTDALTLSAWIYKDTTGACGPYADVISKGTNASGQSNYQLEVRAGCAGTDTIAFSFVNSVTHTIQGNTPLYANTWYHLVAVYNDTANTIDLYVNGVLQTKTVVTGSPETTSLVTNTRALTIGKRDTVGNHFVGTIDDVRVYNRALSATDVMALYKQGAAEFATSPTTSLTSGLVGYWTFDGKDTNWNTNKTNDLSGNGYTGTLTNTSTTTMPTAGKVGQALKFDGVDDYVNMGDQTKLKLTGAFTISAWINPKSLGGGSRGRIVDKDSGATAGYTFFVDGINVTNGINISTNGASYPGPTSRAVANAVTLGVWQHFIAVFDGTNVYLYKNGASLGAGQTLTAPTSGTNNFVIGGRTTANDRNFDGRIDDVRVYNRVLSATEVLALYKQGASISR